VSARGRRRDRIPFRSEQIGYPSAPLLPRSNAQPTKKHIISKLIHKYLLRSAWLIELIRLAIPPPACILLASASSKALCVTDASSKSLKLLPILGVPSLSCLPLPFNPGLLPASSAVRRGDKGPLSRCRCVPCKGSGRRGAGAVELVEESEVADWRVASIDFLWAGRLVPILRGSPRSVAEGS
jgi:hypothetical protein